MKKKIILALVILTFGGFLFAQKIRVGVVDPDRVLSESKEGRKILSELKSFHQRKQVEINRRTKEVEDLNQKIQTQQGILSQTALQKMADQLDKKQKDLKRYIADANDEMNRLKQEKLASFQREMVNVIGKVAKAKALLVILDKRQLIYSDPIVDVSTEVIGELDKIFDKKLGIGK